VESNKSSRSGTGYDFPFLRGFRFRAVQVVFMDYRETFIWDLKIRFRGVTFRGSGCTYLETVQYGCFCLKIPEIVVGTVKIRFSEDWDSRIAGGRS